jgi:2-polyprenyl-3-methyl-5-hydroxy-6-metoxy-1,4-benzoquinol methylase
MIAKSPPPGAGHSQTNAVPTGPGSDYYDDLYRNDDRTYERPLTSQYYPMYRRAVELLRRERVGTVLEVGCGSGVLAELLTGAGIGYCGFDFSQVAIEKARRRNPSARFHVGDATDPAAYPCDYDALVCCEVLEHIAGDLEAIDLWRRGAFVVCSVPNFAYESHVRHFRSESEVIERYSPLIDIRHIDRVAASPGANLSWKAYFRRIRWARNNPKRLFGILGVNTFSWAGGWFVFVGVRR